MASNFEVEPRSWYQRRDSSGLSLRRVQESSRFTADAGMVGDVLPPASTGMTVSAATSEDRNAEN